MSNSEAAPEERALLVGVQFRGAETWDVHDALDELEQLAGTAGAGRMEQVVVRRDRPNPGTYIGSGQAENLRARVADSEATLVVFDDDLSPAQGRNLERALHVRVLDRTQLILDIFAQHAHTREGSLQIELAQLEYLLPRLRHMWTHLERQQGGIGLRGPGEKQMEMDRRRIQQQMARLRRELDRVRQRRAEQRRGRRRHGWALVALVGYTNAGKSTLLNALTGAEVGARDQLFTTLDPTTRKLELPNRQRALLTDTVGFIKKLPHHLVESFKATLEEVVEADYLLHVIDASHPRVEQHVASVQEVLRELGAGETPTLCVFNKVDCPEAATHLRTLRHQVDQQAEVSAATGEGLEALKHELADHLKNRTRTVKLRLPISEGKLIAEVRHKGKIHEEAYDEEVVHFTVSLPPRLGGRCARFQID